MQALVYLLSGFVFVSPLSHFVELIYTRQTV